MTAITWFSILVVTALMSCPHCWRKLVRRLTVRRVRAALASWPAGLLMQPTGVVPPTDASGCSRTTGPGDRTVPGPVVPARVRLDLAAMRFERHLGRAS